MKPWDSRLAAWMVRPLRDTAVTPNHITTASLLAGLAGAASYAYGSPFAANIGGFLYCLSAFLDHADGELARQTGKTSHFGHVYDRTADLVVKISLFTGMGFGLRATAFGGWAVLLGCVGGASLVAIFLLRTELGKRRGKEALEQPHAGGFEIEDILYAIAPITWLGLLPQFVVGLGIGAPLFALWTASQLRSLPADAQSRDAA